MLINSAINKKRQSAVNNEQSTTKFPQSAFNNQNSKTNYQQSEISNTQSTRKISNQYQKTAFTFHFSLFTFK